MQVSIHVQYSFIERAQWTGIIVLRPKCRPGDDCCPHFLKPTKTNITGTLIFEGEQNADDGRRGQTEDGQTCEDESNESFVTYCIVRFS